MSSNTTPPSDWNSPDGDSPYQPTSPSSQSYPQSYEPTSPYGSVYSSPSPSDDDKKGFFGSLFDMSFDYYVTPKIAKFVYILAIICAAVMWLVVWAAAIPVARDCSPCSQSCWDGSRRSCSSLA